MSSPFDPSAWRGFRAPRARRRRPGRPRKNPALNQFYGFSVDLIAEWCAVAKSTAHGYKTGRLTPSKPAAKLFRLHRDRKVLTAEWKGWVVKNDCIVDPDENETNRNVLRNYSLMVQCVRELARSRPAGRKLERWCELFQAA